MMEFLSSIKKTKTTNDISNKSFTDHTSNCRLVQATVPQLHLEYTSHLKQVKYYIVRANFISLCSVRRGAI